MNKKIVCFDVDGTLTRCKSSWQELSRGLELPHEKISEVYYRTEDGSMTFAEGEKILKDIYLACKNANKENTMKLFENIPVREDAFGLVDYLKLNNYLVYLVSGTVDLFVEMVAKQVAPHGFIAHSSFKFNEHGDLCDIDYTTKGNQRDMKTGYLRKLSKLHDVPLNEIFFAGDSENDIDSFKLTGRGIAVEPFSELLRPSAWKTVKSLSEIKNIL